MTGRGLHHVTAIATDCASNLDFYTRVLGLRLVKRTVTHEDPGSYHLFYGCRDGEPGDRLSFFSWPSAAAGGRGVGEAQEVSFAIPVQAVEWWMQRLELAGIRFGRRPTRLGQDALWIEDPDGTPLVLVASDTLEPVVSDRPDIPPRYALRGMLGVTMNVRSTTFMAAILREVLGFEVVESGSGWTQFMAHEQTGGQICLLETPMQARGRLGAGSIHHVAFRARDEADLAAMAGLLKASFGIVPSEVKDRTYFRSIYFRGPDGLLVEISTDGPGFLIDEAPDELGTRLVLPPGLEPRRAELTRILPPLV